MEVEGGRGRGEPWNISQFLSGYVHLVAIKYQCFSLSLSLSFRKKNTAIMIMRQKKDRKKKMEAMDTKVQLRRESRLPLDET